MFFCSLYGKGAGRVCWVSVCYYPFSSDRFTLVSWLAGFGLLIRKFWFGPTTHTQKLSFRVLVSNLGEVEVLDGCFLFWLWLG